MPKTIDNDLEATDYTVGFQTAVEVASEAIDRLHTTAESHDRIIICEVMGRYAGWIALAAGLAGGADVILIPEIDYDLDRVVGQPSTAGTGAATATASSWSPRAPSRRAAAYAVVTRRRRDPAGEARRRRPAPGRGRSPRRPTTTSA